MKPNTADCSNGAPASDAAWRVPAPGTAARILLAALTVYKRAISPYFAGSCRFLPSCADYAREAVTRHGALRGSWLAARRLARCHPLCTAGYDPVPLPAAQEQAVTGADVQPPRAMRHASH